jgi:hypothetical protein
MSRVFKGAMRLLWLVQPRVISLAQGVGSVTLVREVILFFVRESRGYLIHQMHLYEPELSGYLAASLRRR